ARAQRELALSLQQITTDANLTQAQLDMLAGVFPELAATFGSVLPGGENDIASAMDAVEKAKADLRRAYEKEAAELERVIDRTKDFIKNIQDFQKALKVDNSLSPLSSYDRFLEAQKQFRDVSALAATGDEDAMGKLESVSREYLDEARSYYASSEAYFDAFNEVQRILDNTLSKAEKQLSTDEKQLEALKDQVGKLIDIDDSVMSVADAINNLAAAQTKADAALTQHLTSFAIDSAYKNALGRSAEQAGVDYWQGQINKGASVGDVVNQITNSNEAKVQGFYKDILGRRGSDAEIKYWLDTGKSLQRIHDEIVWAKAHGSYASGGYTGDIGTSQIAGVVHGQEFVMNAEATRRWRPQFEAMNAGRAPAPQGDNGETAREIRELRAEVKRLTAVVAAGAIQTTQAVERGNAVQADVASDLRKVASR
ncbi:MAG TPA: DUF4214 domain-containing protein, partial [Tianweitania sediminis]|nr:DUF4214 domain-containing protein [Tianweitania sediminis]